jgi:Family of unknown function (DUF6134)
VHRPRNAVFKTASSISSMRGNMLRVGMQRVTMSVLALCATAAGTFAEMPPVTQDPFRLYGNEIRFDVERDGDVVGQHVVTFTRTDDGFRVDSRADVDVQLLFIPAYSFRYQAQELWQDGELFSLDASTNEDGDYTHVQATRGDDGLRIESTDGAYEAPPILPISHWNAALLRGGLLLNTMNGELSEIAVADGGVETVSTRSGSLHAHRYLYSGDLNGEIWYDSDGRWVKLRFEADDGSVIDYICRRCRAPASITEAE